MSGSAVDGPLDLSVIIPAYNEEKLIGQQLSALATQEWAGGRWEVIVVDNRSTDRTVAVAESFAHQFKVLRVVAAADRAGLSYARNTGIAAAAADHIAICDADDIVAPGWIAAMGEVLRSHRFVTGRLEVDRLNEKWLADSRGRRGDDGPMLFADYFPWASGGNLGLHRDVWEQLGGFREGAEGAEDILFSMEAWVNEIPLHYQRDAVLHYRYRGDARSLWRQGRAYGRSRTAVHKELRSRGFETSPFAGWRSWVWLVAHLPLMFTRERRLTWVWVAANRLGHLEGSIRNRTLAL